MVVFKLNRKMLHESNNERWFFIFFILLLVLKSIENNHICESLLVPCCRDWTCNPVSCLTQISPRWRFLSKFSVGFFFFKAEHSGVWSEIPAPLWNVVFIFFSDGTASKPAANSNGDEAETRFHSCSQQPTELFVCRLFFVSLKQKTSFFDSFWRRTSLLFVGDSFIEVCVFRK